MELSNFTKSSYFQKDFIFLEQYVKGVCSYTSRYNNTMSVSYAPDNIIGKPVNYPTYGDFPDTYMLRSYGKWWRKLESAQKEYMPQDVGEINAEDYIVLEFEHHVIPSTIIIYETYNPGAVVRIWGGKSKDEWILLWEGPPQLCEPTSRLFIPPIRPVIELIQLDLNQSHLRYHTSIDAVLLVGHKPRIILAYNLIKSGLYFLPDNIEEKKILPAPVEAEKVVGPSAFSVLPYEVIVFIFSFLDLRSLCRCAQVNQTFRSASSDCSLYRQLCLKRYWNKVSNSTLQYLTPKCILLRKLDLSWCGDNNKITDQEFARFLQRCGAHLTHLSLEKCSFIEQYSLDSISLCRDLTDLRLRHLNLSYLGDMYLLAHLTNLQSLDLYSSSVDDHCLIQILKSNLNLQHLIIDLCEGLEDIDFITETMSIYNKQLRSFSCWKTHSLSSAGIRSLSKCSNLRDVDVGWCLVLTDPSDCIMHLAQGCPNLIRFIIAGCRGLMDRQLLPLIQHCPKMRQIDLLGARNISGDICEQFLRSFRDMEMMDVSFCDQISNNKVEAWRIEFPNVAIQRSCEYIARDCWYS